MSNTFLTPEVVAKEALMVLTGNLVMADLVHRDYSEDFVSVGDTITVRKPAKFSARTFNGQTEAQDITESGVSVQLDRFRDVTVAVSSKQMSLDIADFSAQVVEPAMQAIAQAIDQDILSVAVESAKHTLEGTENAADLADIAAMAKQLDMAKAPVNGRSLVLHPEHKYRYALTDNLSAVSYAGDNETLRDALLGRVYTLDTYMDQNAPDSLAESAGNAYVMAVTGSKGMDTVSLSGVKTSTADINAGDGFILNGYLYRFTETVQATSGAVASVHIDQPLQCDAQGVQVVCVNKPHSVAFHRNAIALVTRNLALPMGASNAAYASAGGLGVRVVYDYDSTTKTDKISFDVIYGIKALDENMICTLVG